MREIPVKNYVILFILLIVSAIVTLVLVNIFKKNNVKKVENVNIQKIEING